MRPPEFRVISIGTLAAHPLWNEKTAVRTGHATSTLITTDDVRILVNPGLPPQALAARFDERTDVKPDAVTHVFLTTFTIDHYRGLALFPEATWLLHEPERDAARAAIEAQMEHAETLDDPEVTDRIGGHLDILAHCQAAEDHLVPGVDLFPLPGYSPGTCGLLLPLPRSTVLISGDAVATNEHLQDAKVLPDCVDIEQAQESFKEAIEIADLIVPGRDNILMNPLRPVM